MDDETLKKWVRGKLDSGFSEKRVKKVLERQDYDPSIVDEVQSPFEDEDIDRDEEEIFGPESGEEKKDRRSVEEEIEDGEVEEKIEEGEIEEKIEDGEVEEKIEDGSEDVEDESSSSFLSGLKDVSMPSLPSVSLPSFSVPRPGVDLAALFRKTAPVLVFVLLIAGGYWTVQEFNVLEPQQCVDGRMFSLTASDSSTVVGVEVEEEAKVVLEVFEEGDRIGKKEKVLEGQGVISVDAVGDEVSFHGFKCSEEEIRKSY